MIVLSIFKKTGYPRIALAALAVVCIAIWVFSSGEKASTKSTQSYLKAEKGTFTVALPTGGSLEAVEVVTVRNEVPGFTRIISIVDEGAFVEEGDLLVELDSDDIMNRLSQAEIAYQKGLSEVAEHEERVETIESENVIRLSDAELALEFAKQDLVKFEEGEWPQLRKKAESEITLATEELSRAKDRLVGTRRLEEKGYATSSELVADQLVVQRREIELESAKESLRLLTEFDYPQRLRQLQANVSNANIRLDRTQRQNATLLEKSKQQLASIRKTLAFRDKDLKSLRKAKDYTRIYAPQDGLVVYEKAPSWRHEPIEEGSTVRERQTLISLPDVTKMKIPVSIYENQISLVKPGMRAYVHIDAFPGERFMGQISSVATMPEPARESNPSNRVYKVEVMLEESIPEAKPGITARVEVLIAELKDAIKVPLQSVVAIEDRQFCYVEEDGKKFPVEVKIGLFDNEFVEIVNGINDGDMVVLTPPTLTEIPEALVDRDKKKAIQTARSTSSKTTASLLPDA